jgi:DNA-binding transcriptional MerR regulator
VIEKPCSKCHGSGRERRRRTFTVKIKPGVKDGTKIRLKGKGEAGQHGGPNGDLIVVTRVDSSPTYERRGDDLIVQVPVSFPTAALGGKVEVPTPEGAVSLKIPAGSEDGKLLRIKGRGAPKLGGKGKGDVLARVRIQVPKRVNKKERELLEELQKGVRAPEGGGLMEISDRPIYMISVAAELVGMHPQTLRMYETKGLVRPQRTPGGTRLYSEADIERLRIVQRLTTQLGLNLAGVELVLRLEDELRKAHAQIERLQRQHQRDVQKVHKQYRRDLVLVRDERLPERQSN